MTVACVRFGEYRVEYREIRFEGEGFSTRFLFFFNTGGTRVREFDFEGESKKKFAK